MNENEKHIEEFIKGIEFDDSLNQNHRDSLERELLRAFPKHRLQRTAEAVWKWSTIVNNKITKFAAAAVIIVAAMLGITHFGGSIDGASVAWADITEKVNQIHTYTYNLHATFTGSPKDLFQMETKAFFSSEHGLRSEMYMNGKLSMIQHLDLANKTTIRIMPEQKKYINIQLSDERLQDMNQKGNGDPRYLIEEFLSLEYTELGLDVIDGVEVEGIETADPRYSGGIFEGFIGRLWVDVETDLPVRLEMQMQIPPIAGKDLGTMNMVMDSFQWDVYIDSAIFEPNLPSDYTALADMKMPEINEESAIKGLQLFKEISKGKYPKKLNMLTLMGEFQELTKANWEQTRGQNDPNSIPPEEVEKMLPNLMTVQGACMFYAKLVTDNKEPVYYGDIVTADDPDAVLMRWKVNDGQYRVIFGDLTIENVTAEQLAELESNQLNN